MPHSSIAQVTNSDVKAAFILQICENVIWETQQSDTFRIGCITKDETIYNLLKVAEEKISIQGGPFRVSKIGSNSSILRMNTIYYDGQDFDYLNQLHGIVKNNDILLITDNIEDELFVFINLLDGSENVTFKCNLTNLAMAGLKIQPNLLLNGGSVVDINEAYEKFENRLKDSRNRLEQSQKAVIESEQLLGQKDAIIKEKESEIDAFSQQLDFYKVQSQNLKDDIEKERKQLELQRKELDELQNEILLKENKVEIVTQNLEQLQNESNTLKLEIDKKNATLNKQQTLIDTQQRRLSLAIILVLALSITGFTLYRLFTLKKKHSEELSHKVEERTKELQSSNARYQALFQNAPVALLETDFSIAKEYVLELGLSNEKDFNEYNSKHPDFAINCLRKGRLLQSNQAFLDLYKIDNRNGLMEIYEQINKAGKLKELGPEFKMIFSEQSSNTFEATRYDKNKNKIELIITWANISGNKGDYSQVLFSFVDVTHLRQIEQELLKHQNHLELLVKEKTNDLENANNELKSNNEMLSEQSQIINNQNNELKTTLNHLKETQAQLVQAEKMASLGVLTSGVAHEINNPLNYIMGAYEGLKGYLDHFDSDSERETISQLLSALKTGVDRAADIVKSLNLFSRQTQNEVQVCNMHEILDNCLLMLKNNMKNNIEIIKQYDSKELVIFGNIGDLHQVFLNLLANSERSIENSGEITIKTFADNNNINIEILDTGIGIEKENLSKIIEPFYTTKPPGDGTGLGLSITYNIIKEHQGMLEFESTVNKGTCARVIFPVKEI